MIFLFVLFGALLEKAGAGNYFIKLSFCALGHLKGGPAKAAHTSFFTGFIFGFLFIFILATSINFLFSWTTKFNPLITSSIAILFFLGAYISCIWIASKKPDLTVGLSDEEIKKLPNVKLIADTGYHYVLPIIVLLWCVLISRLSPSLSA